MAVDDEHQQPPQSPKSPESPQTPRRSPEVSRQPSQEQHGPAFIEPEVSFTHSYCRCRR